MQDVVIDRPLESVGVMAVTTFSTNPTLVDTGEGLGLDERSVQELGGANTAEKEFQVSLVLLEDADVMRSMHGHATK
jgi:hypothetical protein